MKIVTGFVIAPMDGGYLLQFQDALGQRTELSLTPEQLLALVDEADDLLDEDDALLDDDDGADAERAPD